MSEMTVGRVMDAMIVRAKMYMELPEVEKSIERNAHMNKYRGPAPDKELIAAIIVDFLNYSAGTSGMDLGLYTIDVVK